MTPASDYTILIVDDQASNLDVLSDLLESHGFKVLSAREGEAALEIAQRARPDLILLDVVLPGVDGFEACRQLKADQRTKEIPVIFMTVLEKIEDKIRGFQVGAVDYITKPFQVEEVLARVTTQLRLRSLARELQEANDTLERRVEERTAQLAQVNQELQAEVVERISAEEALREGETRWRSLTENSPDHILTLDQELNIEFANYASPGLTVEELIGTPLYTYVAEDRQAEIKALHEQVLETGKPTSYETEYDTPDGSVIYYESRVVPRILHDEVIGLTVNARDITARKQAEKDRLAHLRFLESLDRANRAIQGTNDLKQMMSEVLDAVLSVFDCDRAYLLYPCDPEAASWTCPMERTRPEYPGALALGQEIPTDKDVAETFRILRASAHPVKFGPGTSYPLPAEVSAQFGFKTFMSMALYPKVGKPWQFGIHQCSYPRTWTPEEERLLQEIGQRLADGLTSLLMFRNLQESEHKLEEAQRVAHIGHWDLDLDAECVTGSDELSRIFGLDPHKGWFSFAQAEAFIHPDDRQIIHDARILALGGGPHFDVEYRIIRPTGEMRYVHSQGDVIRDEAGKPRRMFGIMQDITERKRAEEALAAERTLLRTVIDNLPDYIYAKDTKGRFTLKNLADVRQMGAASPDEVIGKTDFDYYPPELADKYHADDQAVLQSGHPLINREEPTTAADGTESWILTSKVPLRDAQGDVVGLVGIGRDITERKRAEADLRKLSQAVEQSPASIIITDAIGNIEYVNPGFTQATGYSRDEVLGRNPRILKSGETPPEEYRRLWDTITHGDVWHGEFHNKKKNGDLYWESASISPVFDSQGSIRHFIAVKEDITERKQREIELEALVTAATALRAALRRDEVLCIVADQVFDLLRTGGVALLLRSLQADELVVMTARGAWEHWIDVHLSLGEGISGQVVSTGEPFVSDDVRTDDLLYRPDLIGDQHAVACVPLIAKGEVIGVLWVGQQVPVGSQDVRLLKAVADMAATAIRRAILHEQAQRHAAELEERVDERTRELAEANERLLELDQLKTQFVSNVSHELRTPITNLKLHLDLLMRGKPEKREHHMAVLKQQANRLTQLVEDILDLSRLELGGGEIAFAQVDLNKLVDQVVTAHQAVADHANLRLTFEPGSDLPPVRGEVNQLAQVVTNLVINALNYTPVGSVQIRTYLEDGHVCLEVEDTGTGIDPEDLPHLFERFYRGKGVSQGGIRGTGLGLAIVKEIVDLHKGSIEIDSQQGKGTIFTVRLPPEE